MSPSRYAAFYCEENIWWLAQSQELASSACEVAVISNARRAVAMFHQRAARSKGAPIAWDYHVVLAALDERGAEVWDLDCSLGAPLPASRWIAASFDAAIHPMFHPRFRVLDAREYVRTFSSDRAHMKTRAGHYRRPPPPWDPIVPGEPNLMRLIDLGDPICGEIIDLAALRARWRSA